MITRSGKGTIKIKILLLTAISKRGLVSLLNSGGTLHFPMTLNTTSS